LKRNQGTYFLKKREINKIKKVVQDVKEELNNGMESLKKKKKESNRNPGNKREFKTVVRVRNQNS
jgi:hypothetical protein